ncbi:hypothetical protein F3B35_07075 [Bacteroides intestinalis]|uniref:Uncharacterized protein n=2 Tax=Bacteroides TaxID=816 RepID=A0A412PAG7_9BACE|nr:hypothetical protein F3B37_20765 [Bacteroides intestinalis]KAB4164479.1 hypothetical protein GAQ59_22640 [Bacteroides uniformis]KAA4721651.1 hypothetical protein F3B35_07075 [Bacteroides intestinalis]QDO69255.1 hypothetical protein DXK01_010120 [Bacteroides intestinalis]RGJ51000.1 hypothetical protein DXD57_18675 [Bacteroides intestinalis]
MYIRRWLWILVAREKKKSKFKLFHARRLPSFAIALAKLCHRIGKVVPSHWQSRATTLAKACQYDGKILAI